MKRYLEIEKESKYYGTSNLQDHRETGNLTVIEVPLSLDPLISRPPQLSTLSRILNNSKKPG